MSRRQRGVTPPQVRDAAKQTPPPPRLTREQREQLRAQMAAELEAFLDAGGVIIQLPPGEQEAHRKAHGKAYNRKG